MKPLMIYIRRSHCLQDQVRSCQCRFQVIRRLPGQSSASARHQSHLARIQKRELKIFHGNFAMTIISDLWPTGITIIHWSLEMSACKYYWYRQQKQLTSDLRTQKFRDSAASTDSPRFLCTSVGRYFASALSPKIYPKL